MCVCVLGGETVSGSASASGWDRVRSSSLSSGPTSTPPAASSGGGGSGSRGQEKDEVYDIHTLYMHIERHTIVHTYS